MIFPPIQLYKDDDHFSTVYFFMKPLEHYTMAIIIWKISCLQVFI